MKVNDIKKAQELVEVLVDGLNVQEQVLENLRVSLNNYVEFLQDQIKELRNGD